VLEFAEVVAVTHYLYNIEQIFASHQISLSDSQLTTKPEMLLSVIPVRESASPLLLGRYAGHSSPAPD